VHNVSLAVQQLTQTKPKNGILLEHWLVSEGVRQNEYRVEIMNISTKLKGNSGPGETSICVFCGSRSGQNPAFVDAAVDLGRELAKEKIRLVYGGAGIGMMGAVARAVLESGGQVTGIVPQFLREMETQLDGVTDLIITKTMHERKQRMYKISDAFVIMPGGLGTLDETMEVLTWRQLEVQQKPIVMANIDGYWEPFLKLINHVVANDYSGQNTKNLFTVVNRVKDIIPATRHAAVEVSAI
jgi:hypothetical protein